MNTEREKIRMNLLAYATLTTSAMQNTFYLAIYRLLVTNALPRTPFLSGKSGVVRRRRLEWVAHWKRLSFN